MTEIIESKSDYDETVEVVTASIALVLLSRLWMCLSVPAEKVEKRVHILFEKDKLAKSSNHLPRGSVKEETS